MHTIGTGRYTVENSALRDAVAATLAAGGRELTVDVDALGWLDNETIRELIRGLRQMREVGGTLHLSVARPDLLRTLSSLGLDRVFGIK